MGPPVFPLNLLFIVTWVLELNSLSIKAPLPSTSTEFSPSTLLRAGVSKAPTGAKMIENRYHNMHSKNECQRQLTAHLHSIAV